MEILISGRILAFDEEERLLTLIKHNQRRTYYLQRSMINRIGKYLEPSRFIQFIIEGEPRIYRGTKVYNVDYVVKIMAIRYRKNIVYYDIKNIQHGTKTLVNKLNVKMFLDLEMSMHPYKVDKTFKQEIIQVGIHMVDENNNVIYKYNEFVKPTIHHKITRRTIKFLKVTQEEVDAGLPYKEFYQEFERLIREYNPAIIVWGRNDFLALRESYKINNLPNLNKLTRYINLLKLHKNYFNLKNDLGLFNALSLYQERPDEQAHNAYEDALVTSSIFNGFKKVVNGKLIVDVSNYK